MIPPTIASLVSTAVLVWVYAYLSCTSPRRKYLAILTLGWTASLIKTAFELAMAFAAGSTLHPHLSSQLNTGHLLFALLNGFLVLWGTYVFLKRRLPRLSLVPWVLVLLWILGSALVDHGPAPLDPHALPHHWVTSPFLLNLAVYELLAGAMIISGILFLRHSTVPGPEKYTAAVLFIVWGLHRADHPFVLASSNDVLQRAGYQVASGLQIATAVAILLLFFKAANLELARSEKRYRLLADNALDLITVISPAGELRFISPAIRLLGNYEPHELLGRNFTELVHPDDVQTILKALAVVAAEGNVKVSFRGRRKDGTYSWLEATNTAVFGPDGAVQEIVSVSRDITERRAAEDALRQSEEHHRQVAETNRRLLQEVNHRVRNNLGALFSLVDLIEPKATDIPDFAAAMRARVGGMATIHNLLSHAGWGDVELRGLLEALIHSAEPLAPHRAELVLEGPTVILRPPKVVPLAMAVLELLTNSCKYGAYSRKGGRLHLTWTVRPHPGRDMLEIAWCETGGPAVTHTMVPSLGSQLVEGFINHEMGGRCQLRYTPEGANHLMEFPLGAKASAAPTCATDAGHVS